MNRMLFILPLLFLTSCQKPDQPLPPPPKAMPDNRELCEHFAGEDPYDAERAAYIKRKMDELHCK